MPEDNQTPAVFKRPHHQRVAQFLSAFDVEFLWSNKCYFGGGTAIVLALGEYRESLDVDFLCSSQDGYKAVRNTISPDSLGRLLKYPVPLLRDVRTDQYGVRTFAKIDEVSIKFELIFEGRIALEGEINEDYYVPTLSKADMQAEKLLANADRGLDKAYLSRDIIDLAMTIMAWGAPTQAVWDKAKAAYGPHVVERFEQARKTVSDDQYLLSCLRGLSMDVSLCRKIQDALGCRRPNPKSTLTRKSPSPETP